MNDEMLAALAANTAKEEQKAGRRRSAKPIVRAWLQGKGPAPTLRQLADALADDPADSDE